MLSCSFDSCLDAQILNGSCLDILKKLPDASIDLVFADPPYNLQLGKDLYRPDNSQVDAVDDDWDRFESFAQYDSFCQGWLRECRRILKPNGGIWVMGSYHNIFRLGTQLQDLGFWILNDVIWRKTNPMPNFRGTRFTNAHETLIWAARSQKSKPVFNYEAMKSLNEGTQMRSDWHLPICQGKERLKDETGTKLHPTQKPESLLYRVILSSTKPGALILDPFFGTGTTGAVAKALGRRIVGIEQDPSYAKAAQERLCKIPFNKKAEILSTPAKREIPRIPFGTLIENGMLSPGATLVSLERKYHARVRADGTLIAANDTSGSIHQVGAKLQGAPSCNGWTFWHVDEGEDLICIDALRDKVRSTLAS